MPTTINILSRAVKHRAFNSPPNFITTERQAYFELTPRAQKYLRILRTFEGSKLWGDGWGWALFKPGAESKNAATDYKKDCLGCHVPVKDKDWIYTEAYPTLSAK